MKYFTKEFYNLLQLSHANIFVKKSKKAENFDENFYQRTYEKQCAVFLKNEKSSDIYRDPKEDLRKIDDYINEPNITDEERNRRIEFKKMHEYLNRKRIESGQFCEFDEQLSKRVFAEAHKKSIETFSKLPTEIKNKIADIRVFALGYASEEVKKMLRPYCAKLKQDIKQVLDKAYAETDKADKLLSTKINFNDCNDFMISGIEEKGNNIYLKSYDNEYLIFKNGKITEGKEMPIYQYNDNMPYCTWSRIIAAELHSKDNIFEANFLVSNLAENEREELWYLSISCSDIQKLTY